MDRRTERQTDVDSKIVRMHSQSRGKKYFLRACVHCDDFTVTISPCDEFTGSLLNVMILQVLFFYRITQSAVSGADTGGGCIPADVCKCNMPTDFSAH